MYYLVPRNLHDIFQYQLHFQKHNNLHYLLDKLKTYYRINGIDKSTDDIYKQAFKTLPKVASSDSSIRKMYANRSFLLW